MSKEPSSFDLSPEKLARLWSVGSDVNKDEDEVDQEQKKAELLRDWLESALPLDPALAELLPTVLMRMFRELRPFAGESFNSLLLDPETDVSALKKIKSFSKKLVEAANLRLNMMPLLRFIMPPLPVLWCFTTKELPHFPTRA